MATHAAHNARRITPKPREKGAAHGHVHHEKRHKTTEGRTGYVGAGAILDDVAVYPGGNDGPAIPGVGLDSNGLTAYNSSGTVTMTISAADGSVTITGTGVITGGVIQTSVGFPKVRLDTTGLKAYNSAGVNTFLLDAATGNLTVNGTGVITGGTIQTSASNPRVIMDGTGLRAYNPGGSQTFSLSGTDGSLTVTGTGTITGATIQSSVSNPRVVIDSAGLRAYDVVGTQRVNLGADGSFNLNNPAASITAAGSGVTVSSSASGISGARVVVDPTGIRGYDAGGTRQFLLDAASGLISATGVLQAQPGSTVPWGTTGFYVGGGNLVSNSSAEDPTTTTQLVYFTTGAGVTAGTFTLRYGSNTITSALSYNSTAAQVQTALNATGVLPSGITATCTGGPLPGAPIVVSLSGGSSPALTVFTTASALTGGSALAGPAPVGWVQGAGVTDFIAYSSAFHGGGVFRINSTAASQAPSIVQTLGPYGLVPGTSYTVSGYFEAPTATRSATLSLSFLGPNQNTVATGSLTSSWVTGPNWQRLIYTLSVPPAPTRQMISITGTPTGGSFRLTYNGQTTATIAFNAAASAVQGALQALSNVGSSGVAYVTGGPLPGTPVEISFVSPPAASPAALTFTNSLTGGTSPTVVISNRPATYVQLSSGISGAAAGEIFYLDAVQLVVGDAPVAYAPRPDEIVANKVTANMINVGLLSAISANIGTVTAGSLNSVTITSAVVQTSPSNPRVWMDTTGFYCTNSSGTATFSLSASTGNASFTGNITGSVITGTIVQAQGMALPASTTLTSPSGSTLLQWTSDGTTSGTRYAMIFGTSNNEIAVQAAGNSIVLINNATPVSSGFIFSSASGYGANQAVGGNLQINGTVTVTGNSSLHGVISGNAGGSGSGIQFVEFAGHTVSANWNGSVLQWYLDGTAVNTASSMRLKRDIEPIQGALDTVRQMRGVSFYWDGPPFDTGTQRRGLVAEEVAMVLPSAVHSHQLSPQEEAQITLDLPSLIATLVEAVKELDERMDSLSSGEGVAQAILSANSFEGIRDAVRDHLVRDLELRHFKAMINGQDDGPQVDFLEEKIAALTRR